MTSNLHIELNKVTKEIITEYNQGLSQEEIDLIEKLTLEIESIEQIRLMSIAHYQKLKHLHMELNKLKT